MIGPIAIGVAALLVATAFGAGFVARRRQESRARLLEVLARAVTRGRPLPPLTARIASEVRGGVRRGVDALTRHLAAGHGLADSFDAARNLLPARDVVAIRHAEDGPALASVLEELARDAGRGLMIRHRIGLALAYPVLLLPLVAFVAWRTAEFSPVLQALDIGSVNIPDLMPVLPFLGFAALGVFVLLYSPSFSWLKPRRISFVSRTAAEARLYRLAAVHLEAGRPLPDALRFAAASAGRRSVGRRAEDAAARIARGEAVEGVWPWFPPAGGSLVGRLRRVADLRRDRQHARTARRLALVHPLTVLAFGVIAFLQFHLVMSVLANVRGETLPW